MTPQKVRFFGAIINLCYVCVEWLLWGFIYCYVCRYYGN